MISIRRTRRSELFSLLTILALVVFSACSQHHHHSHERLHRASPDDGRHVSLPVVDRANTSPPAGFSVATINDDPYTCGPGRPCSNGACCGKLGNCGYGPTYCETGCQSQCSATAECGQFAQVPGTTCPLNACCSEFGFCGTTHDFCTGKCQSNCVLEPKPPGGSPKGASMTRVIGYYESWSYRSKCNQKSPMDLPLTELTHLNYAFAFIDPNSYELTTMNTETTEDLWQLTVDTKRMNHNLKVYVAVGGWTFSDNGTVTQPLLGEISRSQANRQKFANGVVRFLNKYGFDGLDIDWEYPGAPDRGGKPDDTANFVLLMQTLRAIFDASPRMLGLTFTIPSSYWYLRWFDMPGLLKYADWANMMSYDLHGSWDSSNPIGPIAQAHTNLTEIDLAAQLLWRVGVKPEQVSLGYGFYGRSFELADPSCATPGCPFKGGAKEGPCSKTSGVLMYYEIQAILKQIPDLKPVFDKNAAVKYLVFDKNQWVSYDDEETFKLKKEWANKIGFGGSMIWAVDTDDSQYTAMSGLLGYPVSHVNNKQSIALAQTSANVAKSLQGQNGQGCKALTDLACRPANELSCGSGETMIGWDRNGCSSDQEGVPICCPGDAAPKKCTWRGSGNDGGIWGDCNGQCHVGESHVLSSKWGGGPEKDRESDPYKCARGDKVFCCEAGDYKTVVQGCRWTECFGGGSCDDNTETQVATKKGACPMSVEVKYCCPRQTPLHDCVWRGTSPDCSDPNCLMKDGDKEVNEVQIDAQSGGDSWNLCSWGRKKGLCCQVSKPIPQPLDCPLTSCDFDLSLCLDEENDPLAQRDIASRDKGKKRPFGFKAVTGERITFYSLVYTGLQSLWAAAQAGQRTAPDRYFARRSNRCRNGQLEPRPVPQGEERPVPASLNVEHTVPLVTLSRFAAVANYGRHWLPASVRTWDTPRGPFTRAQAIPTSFWRDVWRNATLPAGLTPVNEGAPDLTTPSDRVFQALGSETNNEPFTFLEDVVNGVKGQLEIYNQPMAEDRLNRHIRAAVGGNNQEAVNALLAPLREARDMFRYLREDSVMTQTDNAVTAIRNQLRVIEDHNQELAHGLVAHWDEFYPYYYSQVSQFARDWGAAHILYIRDAYNANPQATNYASVLADLEDLESSIKDWKYAFED